MMIMMVMMSMTTMMMMDFGERSDQISHLAIDFLPPTAAVLQLQEGITITTMMMMMTITITRTMRKTMRMTMINFGERRRREEGGDTMHLLLIRSALLWKC